MTEDQAVKDTRTCVGIVRFADSDQIDRHAERQGLINVEFEECPKCGFLHITSSENVDPNLPAEPEPQAPPPTAPAEPPAGDENDVVADGDQLGQQPGAGGDTTPGPGAVPPQPGESMPER